MSGQGGAGTGCPGPVGTYYVVRHGKTEANLKNILQGHLDIPLSGEGKAQAEKVANALSGISLDAVFSSDLSRAQDTAKAIARVNQCKLVLDRRLRELNYGELQGMVEEDARKKYSGFYGELRKAPMTTPRPGGGESYNDLFLRAGGALEFIKDSYPDGKVAVVTHGGVIRALLAYVKGITVDPFGPVVQNCSISVLSWGPQGWSVEKVNDIRHFA